jgi:hypothetical protein
MNENPTFRQLVTDVFHRHNPLESDCLSVYEPIVNDLFRYWSYSDTMDDLENYIRGVLVYHSKRTVKFDKQLVVDVYETKKRVR